MWVQIFNACTVFFETITLKTMGKHASRGVEEIYVLHRFLSFPRKLCGSLWLGAVVGEGGREPGETVTIQQKAREATPSYLVTGGQHRVLCVLNGAKLRSITLLFIETCIHSFSHAKVCLTLRCMHQFVPFAILQVRRVLRDFIHGSFTHTALVWDPDTALVRAPGGVYICRQGTTALLWDLY